MAAPDSELQIRVTVTLDRQALAELAAALVPTLATHIQTELLRGFEQAARVRPSSAEL